MTMMTVPQLETERLILRGIEPGDFDAFARMMADAEVARFITMDQKPQERADAWRTMAYAMGHWTMRGFGMWAVVERASGRFIGRIGPNYPEGWPDREIGWALARQAWGKGYATEAARRAMDYAFTVLRWPRAISLIHPDNTRSAAVAVRLGSRKQAEPFLFRGFSLDIYAQENPAR
jgi:RimJ/RimL family protein N-acetyltransferase